MDILKRSLAPITDAAWQEIEKEAYNVLKNNLSARKFVDIVGPKGFNYSAVDLGRLTVPEGQNPNEVNYGIRQVQPLVEIRIPFELNIWEMDNVERGATDIDLSPVTEAVKKAAHFEDQVIYHGFEPGNIQGLSDASNYDIIEIGIDTDSLFQGVSKAVLKFKEEAISGPYTMVVSYELWQALSVYSSRHPIIKDLEKLIGGPVIYGPVIKNAYLVPSNAENLQLIIGQDFSIGYESNTSRTVKLYITESFTFRVLDPRSVIHFIVKDELPNTDK